MKTVYVKLPKHLHSVSGTPTTVNFELSKSHFEINGGKFNHNYRELLTSDFKGYIATPLNKTIVVTLFYTEDIIKEQ